MNKTAKLIAKRVALFAALCALAAYPTARMGLFEWPQRYDPLALPNLAQPPHSFTRWQMKTVDFEPTNCALALKRVGITATLKPAKNAGSNCELIGTIDVTGFSKAKIKPEHMRCAMALRLYQWERHVLQPAAQRLLGETISEITHFGSFSCRTIGGSRFMSEHATANAFDISGFRTTSGKLISLKRHWSGNTAEAKFLRAARDGLCDWFNTTLSPDYNAAHADHFHVDMGYWRSCS
jgi:hypothetical protein